MTETAWALKEWAIAVDALLSSELILLIRKGGIREARPNFELPSDRALLFPTYEHQKLSAIRPPFVDHFEDKPVPQVGDEVPLWGWAEITHQLPLTGDRLVAALYPFHIWTDDWLAERLAWKPERPAYALLLRVHRFAQPLSLTYQKQHSGCRSWVELADSGNWPDSKPALPTETYEKLTADIQAAITTTT